MANKKPTKKQLLRASRLLKELRKKHPRVQMTAAITHTGHFSLKVEVRKARTECEPAHLQSVRYLVTIGGELLDDYYRSMEPK